MNAGQRKEDKPTTQQPAKEGKAKRLVRRLS
jgi:hypothetical protein